MSGRIWGDLRPGPLPDNWPLVPAEDLEARCPYCPAKDQCDGPCVDFHDEWSVSPFDEHAQDIREGVV